MREHMQERMQTDAKAMLRTDGRTYGRPPHPIETSHLPERAGETREGIIAMTATPRLDHDRIARLTAQGSSARDISMLLGCSTRQITRIRKAQGLSQPLPPYWEPTVSAERRARIEKLLADGASWSDIEATVHVHRRWLAKHFPGTGWDSVKAARHARLAVVFNRLAA